MKNFDFRKFRQLIPIPVLTVLFAFNITAQCPEYTPNSINNPGICEDIWFLEDNYNVSIYDGCSAEIIFDLTHYPTDTTEVELDTMIIELFTYYNDTETEIWDDPRVTYYNLATEYDGNKYKDFGFVQDPVYAERFNFYNTGTSLKLDSLLDFVPKQPLIDSNDLFIVFMDGLDFSDCITLIYKIKYVTINGDSCKYEDIIDFTLPSEQICGSVSNGFPPDDPKCSETPDDTTISIESENGCTIADATLTDGEFCFRAGEDECVNLYIDDCGNKSECIDADDGTLLFNYLYPPYTLPPNPYFFIVADLDRDGDVDMDDLNFHNLPQRDNPDEGNYIGQCVLIEDPGEETARVEDEDPGLRICDPYPQDDLNLVSLMIGDIDGNCACNDCYLDPNLCQFFIEPQTNYATGTIEGIEIINRGQIIDIVYKENHSNQIINEIRLITLSGHRIKSFTEIENAGLYRFDLNSTDYNGLYILQFVLVDNVINYYIPSLR